MPSLAVLIEAFGNARLAREELLKVETRLAVARSAGTSADATRLLAAEAACLKVRADHLASAAEQLLPRSHDPVRAGGNTATLIQ